MAFIHIRVSGLKIWSLTGAFNVIVLFSRGALPLTDTAVTSGPRSNSTSDRTLALPVQRYTTGHRLTLPQRSQTCHEYFCSQKMLKITKMLPQ